jgi:hypothetical protein
MGIGALTEPVEVSKTTKISMALENGNMGSDLPD